MKITEMEIKQTFLVIIAMISWNYFKLISFSKQENSKIVLYKDIKNYFQLSKFRILSNCPSVLFYLARSKIYLFILICLFEFGSGGTGVWTQSLALARQYCITLTTPPALFGFNCFSGRVSCFQLGPAPALPSMAFCIAGHVYTTMPGLLVEVGSC
jgi:hypothetical protein